MNSTLPEAWESIAEEIASTILQTDMDGYFIIGIENPVYPDLYIQGTWNSEEEFWMEISPTDDAPSEVSARLRSLGWNDPTEDVPNFWMERTWDESQSEDIATTFANAIRQFGVPAEDCELEISVENEK